MVSRRVFGMVEPWVEASPLDDLVLKGFNHPVLAVEILRWREEADKAFVAALAVHAHGWELNVRSGYLPAGLLRAPSQ